MYEMFNAYVYSRNTRTGKVNEYYGILSKGKEQASFGNLESSHHRMTSLSNNEGEVRGHSVWFLKPNREAAIKALDAKDKERAEKLLERSARTLDRMSL